MTGQAVRPIGLEMGLHKISLDLPVAGCAHRLVEFDIVLAVAIRAGKRRAIRQGFMRGEFISKGLMGTIDDL
jgi:hypothetical protein